jgi:hypothetical protein
METPVSLLLFCFHCYEAFVFIVALTREYNNDALLRYRGILACDIAPSLRLLVPSSPQLRRQSVHMSNYHLHYKMPLGTVGMIRRFWRAFIRSLASCSLLRPACSRRSGGAAATARTVRQVTRRWPRTFRSSAASSYAVGVLSPLISPSRLFQTQ